ncbi:MAG TPA: hypothetical protein VGI46_10975 [Candidatus Acidoferrum sp.]
MNVDLSQKQIARRELPRGSATLAGTALLAQHFPGSLLRAAGPTLLAHENTKKCMASPQFAPVINVHSEPAPAVALPQETFASGKKLQANRETLRFQLAPAHTDLRSLRKGQRHPHGRHFFNGVYPVIDA